MTVLLLANEEARALRTGWSLLLLLLLLLAACTYISPI